jgi:hypothetical protein
MKQAPEESRACAIFPDVFGNTEQTFSGEDRIRTIAEIPEVCRLSAKSAAESGAVLGNSDPIDPELLLVIEAWPSLAESSKAAILDIVRGSDPML